MSKRSNQLVGIFLGATVVIAGAALYLYLDESAREKVEGALNREKAKYFIRNKLNGSPALVNAVDKLSDAEITTLVKLSDSATDAKDAAVDSLSDFIDRAKAAGNQVSDKVADYFK